METPYFIATIITNNKDYYMERFIILQWQAHDYKGRNKTSNGRRHHLNWMIDRLIMNGRFRWELWVFIVFLQLSSFIIALLSTFIFLALVISQTSRYYLHFDVPCCKLTRILIPKVTDAAFIVEKNRPSGIGRMCCL